MENWQRKVRQYFEACDLPPQVRDQITAELAAHLEEIEQRARADGMPPQLPWNSLCKKSTIGKLWPRRSLV